jgi:hypothetical protein
LFDDASRKLRLRNRGDLTRLTVALDGAAAPNDENGESAQELDLVLCDVPRFTTFDPCEEPRDSLTEFASELLLVT